MNTSLTTTSERLEANKAKLRVEVPEASLKPALDAAYRRWSNEIRVPGFRKGKVPRQLIDQRVGPEAIREEALREALPDLYVSALESEELEAIAPPEIEVVTFESGVPIVFEATVDLRPEFVLPEYSGITVEAPSSDISDEDLNDQLDRLRDRFAELETIGREARKGDFVVIDLKGYRGEELVEGVSAPDLLHEIGSGQGPPKLDDEVVGSKPGDIMKFNDTMPGSSDELANQGVTSDGPQETMVSFTVLVKEVKAKKLPELDDEFAKNVGEFETLDMLKDDLRQRLGDYQRQMAEQQVRNLVLERFVEAADMEVPERLVDDEVKHRMEHIEQDLASAGMTFEQYAEQTGSTELEVRSEVREQAAQSVKAELLLEEVVRKADIKVDDDDLGREIAYLSAQTNTEPGELAKQLASSGRLRGLVADIMRRKALDHVVSQVNVVGLEPQSETIEDSTGDDESHEQQQEQGEN
ncbi:MAG: trigger factor [Actinomycetota bacterium]|nr:trigger factor [Actinomycetota bacterium]